MCIWTLGHDYWEATMNAEPHERMREHVIVWHLSWLVSGLNRSWYFLAVTVWQHWGQALAWARARKFVSKWPHRHANTHKRSHMHVCGTLDSGIAWLLPPEAVSHRGKTGRTVFSASRLGENIKLRVCREGSVHNALCPFEGKKRRAISFFSSYLWEPDEASEEWMKCAGLCADRKGNRSHRLIRIKGQYSRHIQQIALNSELHSRCLQCVVLNFTVAFGSPGLSVCLGVFGLTVTSSYAGFFHVANNGSCKVLLCVLFSPQSLNIFLSAIWGKKRCYMLLQVDGDKLKTWKWNVLLCFLHRHFFHVQCLAKIFLPRELFHTM